MIGDPSKLSVIRNQANFAFELAEKAFFLSFVFSFHRTKAVKNDVRNEDAPKHNHALRSRQKRAHQAAEGAPRDSQGTGAERKRESERGLKERE